MSVVSPMMSSLRCVLPADITAARDGQIHFAADPISDMILPAPT